jgi:hypothetical protein
VRAMIAPFYFTSVPKNLRPVLGQSVSHQDVIVEYIAIVLASRTGRSGCWPKSSFCSLNWTKLLLFAEADPWTRERETAAAAGLGCVPTGCREATNGTWDMCCPPSGAIPSTLSSLMRWWRPAQLTVVHWSWPCPDLNTLSLDLSGCSRTLLPM